MQLKIRSMKRSKIMDQNIEQVEELQPSETCEHDWYFVDAKDEDGVLEECSKCGAARYV